MSMKTIRSGFFIYLYAALLTGSLAAHADQTEAPAISEAELLHRTQQLYDAVSSGDPTPWKTYYADDAQVYDEKGRTMDKKALVADVEPLPKGYTGIIKVVHPHSIIAPGVAIMAYDCDETETIFGQELHARYHSVDTWLYRSGSWQIAASQTMRYYEDPALGTTDPKHLNDFVGVYELSPGNIRTATLEDGTLFLQRGTGAKVKLLPESGDLFFRSGVEGRVLFHRDSSGKVDALYDRRNNEDVIWKRAQ
jgi:Domain of unknown function (DUF4440)/Domain of unknown function (DUF3471)